MTILCILCLRLSWRHLYIGLICKRALSKRQYSAKETRNIIDPTDVICIVYIVSMSIMGLISIAHMTSSVRIQPMSHTCVYRHQTHDRHRYIAQMTSVGSIILHVSFAEYCLFYRALLQKSPIIYRSYCDTHAQMRRHLCACSQAILCLCLSCVWCL